MHYHTAVARRSVLGLCVAVAFLAEVGSRQNRVLSVCDVLKSLERYSGASESTREPEELYPSKAVASSSYVQSEFSEGTESRGQESQPRVLSLLLDWARLFGILPAVWVPRRIFP